MGKLLSVLWNVLKFGNGGGGGRFTQTHFSNFSKCGGVSRKTLYVRNNFIGNINLGQKSYLNLGKLGMGNDVPDRLSTPFA